MTVLFAEIEVGSEVIPVGIVEDEDEDIIVEEMAGIAHLLSINWPLTMSTNGLFSIRFCSE